MPVTVKTFASFGEAASALSSDRSARYLGGGTLVMRALNEGRYLDLDRRARDRPGAVPHRCGKLAHHARGRRHLRKNSGRTRSCLSARAGPLDRRTGGAQHGHGGRQSVRAQPLWRFHRRAAGARRDRLRPGRPRRPRHANRGISAIPRTPERRAGAGRLLCAARERRRLPLSQDRPHQAEGRLGDHAGRASARQRRPYIGRAHRARLDGRDADSRKGRRARAGGALARRCRRSAPPLRPQRRAYRPPTTPSAAPGIAARSSASIFAACCPAWSKHS